MIETVETVETFETAEKNECSFSWVSLLFANADKYHIFLMTIGNRFALFFGVVLKMKLPNCR